MRKLRAARCNGFARRPRLRKHTVTLYSHSVRLERYEQAHFEYAVVLTGSGAPITTGGCVMSEIIFEVTEDEMDGGYSASALGYGIHTQGESLEDIRRNVKEAVDC